MAQTISQLAVYANGLTKKSFLPLLLPNYHWQFLQCILTLIEQYMFCLSYLTQFYDKKNIFPFTLYFRECLGEAHAPCGCSQWHQWQQKISEVKPEELRASCVETEDAANCLWLVTNSKPCPNCKSPIQKNEGCNHMKCSKVLIAVSCSSCNVLNYLIFR